MTATKTHRPSESEDTDANWRMHCLGDPPLEARVEAWMTERFRDPRQLNKLVAKYGSPLNLVATSPLERNLDQLRKAAERRQLDFRSYFARKANKCLAFVHAAAEAGAGVDVASLEECRQTLQAGVHPSDLICTAAVKTDELLDLCVTNQVCIALDNLDELTGIRKRVAQSNDRGLLAMRVSGFRHQGDKLHSRFGFDIDEASGVATRLASDDGVSLRGIHFHLDGYCPQQRVSAIGQCLTLIDNARAAGHDIRFLDIGGGLPISYLREEVQWREFLDAHQKALRGEWSPVTYRNHGLGMSLVNGEVVGKRNTYPYWQSPVRAGWLESILDSRLPEGETVAEGIRRRELQLRCEPGRSILDGCGVTVARVEFVKRHVGGDHFVGLAMNRTQCRTGSDDFLVDPILLPIRNSEDDMSGLQRSGFLVGAYCTESELLSLRRLSFPRGVQAGDLIVFPNTAGYFMHFLESRSHQFPLAKNLVVSEGSPREFVLDEIDASDDGASEAKS